MKPQALHAHEDRLLDFAYGELPPQEAQAVQSHLEGCTRCSELLAGIGGVRATMAQLPMEPAPDAGLESLLAYAQQAARNAAAGPAPKPVWWRRWLVPVMGVAAVCAFGVVSVTVNQNLHLKDEVASQSVQKKSAEALPLPSAAPSPDESYREPNAPRTPVALPSSAMQKAAPQAQMVPPTAADKDNTLGSLGAGDSQDEERSNALQGITPPPPAPAAKLDPSPQEKVALEKKPFEAGTKGSRSEWSNVGTGFGPRDAQDESRAADDAASGEALAEESALKQRYQYDRRDAMTQSGAFSKPKPILVSPPQEASAGAAVPQQPSTPAQAQAPVMEAPADGLAAESEAQVQQDEPSRLSLRVKEGRSRGSASGKTASPAPNEDFDDLFGGKTSTAKREQSAPSSAPSAPPPPPPPSTAAAAPMPSVSTEATRKPSKSGARAEPRGDSSEPSAAELSKLAQDAQRSGNRVLEAQLLRQALAAVTGKERLGLLNRLCEAEFAIGRRQEALEACALVLEEDPNSSAAQLARNRLRKEGMEADSSKPGSRGPVKAAPAEKKMSAPDSALSQ
ncbi:zf-HC2 domain-containing protein [Hyalangium minutum]|uniref:Putative zinc-finger domain-containing protein n=1 Tax=Hyalangium minutum TaxID=394096 RepID=A0A085WFF7_9BACT|nr:zf-HC2 domain-containing protein [Hyalangium minutum]KFE66420.1 hypothetical protein DB31_0893 [Hyalangium minutum]